MLRGGCRLTATPIGTDFLVSISLMIVSEFGGVELKSPGSRKDMAGNLGREGTGIPYFFQALSALTAAKQKGDE